MLKLLPDNPMLHKQCNKVSLKKGREVARQLFQFIEQYNKVHKSKSAIGLAANQLGINASICVVALPHLKMSFINPIIVERSFETVRFLESCLSFPSKEVEAVRHIWVRVNADNLSATQTFGVDTTTVSGKSYEVALLEGIVVQHELDHIFGLTIFDAAARPQ